MPSRRMLVTSALYYANGPLHLGHLIEAIQTDIWVRFQRLRGHECRFVGGDDAHGTPVMLRARQEGVEPATLVKRMYEEHRRDFKDFHVEFDNYYTTDSVENRELSAAIYAALRDTGHIARRTVRQAYDEQAGMFLPDRYIKGTCPNCGTPDQYGDACENCGATYSPADLEDPVSVVSGTRPIERESEHYFFKLGDFEKELHEWTNSGTLQPAIANKLQEWFEAGLKDWDISRDAPYFGFEIPDAPGKYFYVWLDAPIGYMASFRNYCDRHLELDFDSFWDANKAKAEGTELYHFIGKDIAYFHTLFWPAMLMGSGHRTPTGVFAHGFLTVNGAKMSKSRGTFITARTWLDHFGAEALRYYFAAKLGPGVDDIDLNLEDFVQRVNSDLVGKYVNIASRSAGFLHKYFDGKLHGFDNDESAHIKANAPFVVKGSWGGERQGLFTYVSNMNSPLDETVLLNDFLSAGEKVATAYKCREYGQAIREIMRLADLANQYVNHQQPWEKAREWKKSSEADGTIGQRLWHICSFTIELFKILTVYLKPVLPVTANKVEAFLNIPELKWDDIQQPLAAGHRINRYEHLMTRVDPAQVAAVLEAARESLAKA